jgi:mRNA interferase MazF
MINSLSKNDIIVVKFPFASSVKYKARPTVIISNDYYNDNSRNTFIILAISSQIDSKLSIEKDVKFWKEAGLLKPSIFKSSIATVQQDYVLQKLGTLESDDIVILDNLIENILK